MISTAHPKPRPPSDRVISLRVLPSPCLDAIDAIAAEEFAEKQFDTDLANLILNRIESRLPGRIRHLTVYTTANAVVLAGQCSTFYTKQLAQHAAMGVLEYERLINNIDVCVAK